MPKILYIITQSELGGAQKNALDLACGLKDKYEILVAAGPSYTKAPAGKPDGGGDFFNKLQRADIKHVKLRWLRRNTTNPFADLMGLVEIFNLIKKERPDIVHLHSSKAGFSGSLAAKILGAKVVYTVHGAVFEAAFSAVNRKFYLWLEKFSACFKDKIICVSEKDRLLWLKYNVAPVEKLVAIHNGIDLNIDFATKEEARTKLLANYDVNDDYYLVGSIGFFYPEKNYTSLIKAADLITKLPPSQQKKKTFFLINGDGQQRPLLESLIKEYKLENCFFLPGAIWPGSKYLKAFDVFVLPSIKEGLPYTILEAMAAGVPIVASWVGGIPEMVENGKNGFLILPKNPEMLAEKIAELLHNHDLAGCFVKNSQTKLQEFSLEKMILETETLYKKCLGQ